MTYIHAYNSHAETSPDLNSDRADSRTNLIAQSNRSAVLGGYALGGSAPMDQLSSGSFAAESHCERSRSKGLRARI